MTAVDEESRADSGETVSIERVSENGRSVTYMVRVSDGKEVERSLVFAPSANQRFFRQRIPGSKSAAHATRSARGQ